MAKKKRKPIRRAKLIESFVIAEQIRTEQDTNKSFFIGVYGGGDIKLNDVPDDIAENPIILPLAFWAQVKVDKILHGIVWIHSPNGERLLESKFKFDSRSDGLYRAVQVTGGFVQVRQLGEYTYGVDLGGKRDTRKFRIIENK